MTFLAIVGAAVLITTGICIFFLLLSATLDYAEVLIRRHKNNHRR